MTEAELRDQLDRLYAWAQAIRSDVATAEHLIRQMQAALGPVALPRVRFDAPIGTDAERGAAKLWPGQWFATLSYAAKYPDKDQWHTGVDLNLPAYGDTGSNVYAAASGIVRRAATIPAWGKLIVIEHLLEDQSKVWTRYAHLADFVVASGQPVERGQLIGHIGEYGRQGPPDDHLHYDIGAIDLGAHPEDWPGADLDRLRRDYRDPLAFTKERHPAT